MEDLPQKMVQLIADELEKGYYGEQWILVNKQLYTLHLSLTFAQITLNYQNPTSDKKYNTIVNSSFSPGRLVEAICLTNFRAPHDLENLDRNSTLCKLKCQKGGL